MISSTVAPVLLIGGWTVAAGLQPRSFSPVAAQTISALAAQSAADRWVMTFAQPVVPCRTPEDFLMPALTDSHLRAFTQPDGMSVAGPPDHVSATTDAYGDIGS